MSSRGFSPSASASAFAVSSLTGFTFFFTTITGAAAAAAAAADADEVVGADVLVEPNPNAGAEVAELSDAAAGFPLNENPFPPLLPALLVAAFEKNDDVGPLAAPAKKLAVDPLDPPDAWEAPANALEADDFMPAPMRASIELEALFAELFMAIELLLLLLLLCAGAPKPIVVTPKGMPPLHIHEKTKICVSVLYFFYG
jgi:hypothetical protein